MTSRASRPTKLDKPGILQIAAELGISSATVSRALRPETAHMVSAKRRKQILDLAEKRGFSPNPGARMLRRGVNTTLSVVVPMDERIFFSEFYGRFLAGIIHSADERGWDVQIRPLKRKKSQSFRETMQHFGMESSGVIFLAEPLSAGDLEELLGYRRPLVITKASLPCDADIDRLELPVLGVDNQAGASDAVTLLRQLGHSSIGLLLGPDSSRDSFERKAGYLDAIRKAKLQILPEWVISGAFTVEGGRSGMEQLLKLDSIPTAICCANDEIAFGAITALQSAGHLCPRDFSVVGFDDGLWATMSHPALTTIRQPLADMAERAVLSIIDAASPHGARPSFPHPSFATSLVIRDSTGLPGR